MCPEFDLCHTLSTYNPKILNSLAHDPIIQKILSIIQHDRALKIDDACLDSQENSMFLKPTSDDWAKVVLGQLSLTKSHTTSKCLSYYVNACEYLTW